MKKNARNRNKAEKARVSVKGRKSGFRRISLVLKKLLKRTQKLHTKQKSLKRKDKVLLRQSKTLMSRMEGVEGKASELQLRVTQLQAANRGLLDSLARANDEGVSVPARLDRVESWLGTEEAESERLWKKVDGLDDRAEDYAGRLEILEQNLSTLADSLEELKLRLGNDPDEDGFVAELRRRIETVEGLYAELNEKSVALASAVAELPGDRRPDQTDAPSADQAEVEKRLRSLDEDVARLRQGAASLLREFNDLSARFGDVIGRSGIGQDTGHALHDVESQDSDLAAQADRQGKHLEDINGRARELEERVSSLSAPGELDDKINNLDKGLHDTAAALQQRLGELEAAIGDQQQRAAGMSTDLNSLSDRLAEAASGAEGPLEQGRMLENRIADIAANLDDLERVFNETKSRHQEQLEQLVSDVTEEKRRLTEIPAAVDGLSKRIDDVAGGASKQSEQYLEFKQGIEGLEAARREFITRLDNHERQIQETVFRAEGLDRKIGNASGLNIRVDALEKIQKEMQGGLSGDRDELDQQIRNLTTGHREHLSSYSSFRNTLAIIGLVLLVLGVAGYWFGSDWIATRFADNEKQIEKFGRHLIAQDAQLKAWGRQLASGPSPASPEPGIALEEWNRMKSELELQKKVLSGQVAIHEEYRKNLGTIQRDLGKTRVALDAYLERQEEINTVTHKLGEHLKALEKQPTGSGGALQGRQGTALKDSSWIRQRNPAHYTIQIAGAYGREVLTDISGRLSLPGPLALYQRDWNGREWNVLLYGDFSSKTEAQAAINSFPEEIMAAKPWVRRLSWVQEDLEGR
jgi:chromosome segregation ATPase